MVIFLCLLVGLASGAGLEISQSRPKETVLVDCSFAVLFYFLSFFLCLSLAYFSSNSCSLCGGLFACVAHRLKL